MSWQRVFANRRPRAASPLFSNTRVLTVQLPAHVRVCVRSSESSLDVGDDIVEPNRRRHYASMFANIGVVHPVNTALADVEPMTHSKERQPVTFPID